MATGAVLGGTGSAGNAIVSSGGGIDVSGNSTATLTLASLNFIGNTRCTCPPSLALPIWPFRPALTAGGGAGSVQIDFPNAPLANGTYRLIGYKLIGGAGFSAFSVAQSGRWRRQSTALLNNPNEIDYQVTGQTPYWNATQTDWLATNAWTSQPSGSQTTFVTGDNDVFDDSAGTGAIAVTINAANVAPISVTFNNNQASYNLSGAFGIVDGNTPTFLIKGGTGADDRQLQRLQRRHDPQCRLVEHQQPLGHRFRPADDQQRHAGQHQRHGHRDDDQQSASLERANIVFNGSNDLNLGRDGDARRQPRRDGQWAATSPWAGQSAAPASASPRPATGN